jgi:DNA invertase Pin-like site-specific DNA recombinase
MSTVAYLRCSSDTQDTLRQREDIARSGLTIDQWLEDHESRDRAAKRADFQRLLRAVQAGQVDTIVVQSLDRFGVKDAYEMGKFFSILRDHDCRLLDASGKQLNAEDDGTVITSTVGALASAREQREKASRVLTGNLTLARKGIYLGGYVPYGMDVVAFDAQGNEVWRVVYEGHDRRRKVYPDGREERFDGKNNRPPKALHETLKYRPSIVAERLKYVVLIFAWYVTESISPGKIASRLNDLGISPIFGPLWHRGVVKYLLSNPVYVGRPTYNKASGSRFVEFCGGQVKAVNGKKTRTRGESDHIRPDAPEFAPLIDPQIFDKAQAKLAVTKARAFRAPQTASLWLKGLVYCATCGKPMRGNKGTAGNGQEPGYLCASYGRWGTRSPTCGHYRVDHSTLENLALEFLTQSAPQVKALLDATTATDTEAARPLLDAIDAAQIDRSDVWFNMFFEIADDKEAADEFLNGDDRPAVYGRLWERARPSLEKQVAEKEAELEVLLDGYKDLSPKLRERANKRGEALQDEIDVLNRRLSDLRISWDQCRQDLAARQEALARAFKTLNQEGRHRQKAEVLRAVIGKIICHFTGTGRRVKLESVDVIAAEDAAVRPLSFPPASLLTDLRLGAFA